MAAAEGWHVRAAAEIVSRGRGNHKAKQLNEGTSKHLGSGA